MLASMNFVTAGADGNVRFVLDNGWTGTGQKACEVELRNWRTEADTLSLERDGFVLDRVVSGVTDYADEEQLQKLWLPAVKETLLRVTGGSWVCLFAGPLVRWSERRAEAFSSAISAPARAIHSDLHSSFTFDQFPQQPAAEQAVRELRERLGSATPERWRMFNLWQAISPPPQDTGLAVCKLPSVAAEDVIDGKGYFARSDADAEEILGQRDAPHQFDIGFFRHNPDQQWGYFSDMLPGEALVFSGYDPRDSRNKGMVPHGAVDIPDAPVYAIPRNSIETRALVIFDD